MTFSAYEESTEGGRPIRLYRFTLGAVVWRYTNADEDLTFNGAVYRAVAITDDGAKQTGDATSDDLYIDAQSDIGPALAFASSAPYEPIKVEVLNTHEGETTPQIIYIGEIVQVNWPTPGRARITSHTLSATMRRIGLRLGWQRTCPFAVYDPLTCHANKATYAVPVRIEDIDGAKITSSDVFDVLGTYGAAWGVTVPHSTLPNIFAGGFVEWEDPQHGVKRIAIEQHVGSQITLFEAPVGLVPGMQITAYPGCRQTEQWCEGLFHNLPWYGGFSRMPGKSPFDGIATPFF